MTKVMKEIYPKGTVNNSEDGIYMDENLKQEIEYYAKNIIYDWDFVLIISGNGMVRVGKSLLALQIAAYWKYLMKKLHNIEVPFETEKNIVFTGGDLIRKGNWLGEHYKYSPLIFDEAGADLEGLKVMRTTTKAVKDFLRECGQYNLLTILVIPEFFDIPKPIAINRSHILINVTLHVNHQKETLERGDYGYYSMRQKKKLYINGKKYLDYSREPPSFKGRFFNQYPIDEKRYRELKMLALKNREKKDEPTMRKEESLKGMIKYLRDELGKTFPEIAEIMSNNGTIKLSKMYPQRILKGTNT